MIKKNTGIFLIAAFCSLWQVSLIILTGIDHDACFKGDMRRISDMDLLGVALVLLGNLDLFYAICFFIFLTPFIPFLWASSYANNVRDKCTFLCMSLILAAIMLMLSGSPQGWHDCDRKGSDAGFLLTMPITFLLLISVLFLLARLFRKKSNQ